MGCRPPTGASVAQEPEPRPESLAQAPEASVSPRYRNFTSSYKPRSGAAGFLSEPRFPAPKLAEAPAYDPWSLSNRSCPFAQGPDAIAAQEHSGAPPGLSIRHEDQRLVRSLSHSPQHRHSACQEAGCGYMRHLVAAFASPCSARSASVAPPRTTCRRRPRVCCQEDQARPTV
jgi:hypothetical protein